MAITSRIARRHERSTSWGGAGAGGIGALSGYRLSGGEITSDALMISREPPRPRPADPRQRRQDEEQDRDRHAGPAEGDPAADADRAGDAGRREGADRVGDAVREDLERRVDPAEDRGPGLRPWISESSATPSIVWRPSPTSCGMKTISVATRSGPWASGVRTPSDRRADRGPDQGRAEPEPADRPATAKSEPTSEPTPPAETTTPSRNGLEVQLVDEVDRVQDAVERAGDVGDDRAQGQRNEQRVAAHEPQALDDLAAGSAWRRPAAGAPAPGARMSSSEIAETANETASTRIANGALTSWTRPPARPGPPISASDELVASLLLPSTTRSTPISDGT